MSWFLHLLACVQRPSHERRQVRYHVVFIPIPKHNFRSYPSGPSSVAFIIIDQVPWYSHKLWHLLHSSKSQRLSPLALRCFGESDSRIWFSQPLLVSLITLFVLSRLYFCLHLFLHSVHSTPSISSRSSRVSATFLQRLHLTSPESAYVAPNWGKDRIATGPPRLLMSTGRRSWLPQVWPDVSLLQPVAIPATFCYSFSPCSYSAPPYHWRTLVPSRCCSLVERHAALL